MLSLVGSQAVSAALVVRTEWFRTSFALLAVLILVAGLTYAVWRRSHVPRTIPGGETEPQKGKAIEVRLDLSAKLFDLGILLLGVLWGLVLAEKVVVKFSRWQDTVLFVSCNISLLLSLLFHLVYKRKVATLLWDLAPRQPDISSEHVDYLFQVQWLFFFSSLAVGLLTLLSVKVIGGA